jgi:hypothetical protein
MKLLSGLLCDYCNWSVLKIEVLIIRSLGRMGRGGLSDWLVEPESMNCCRGLVTSLELI